jgi:pimeloyl-ACP methyl ester carboxylesterase
MAFPINALILMVVLFLLLNALALRHAWRMTHLLPEGEGTPPMEDLSLLQKVVLMLDGLRVSKKANQSTPADEGLAYRTFRIPGRKREVLEVWHIPRSDSRGTVILFHGYGDPKDVLIPEAKEFHRWGFETFLVEFPASGGSTGLFTTIGFQEAADVAAAVRRINGMRTPGKLVLFGKSMGAVAIVRSIAHFQVKADGIILECPFDSFDSAVTNRFRIMGIPAWPLGHLITFWSEQVMGVPPEGFNVRRYARRVRVPALHIFGLEDQRATANQSMRLFRALAGEKYKIRFPESGHTRFLEDNPRRWRAGVQAFLIKTSGGTAG